MDKIYKNQLHYMKEELIKEKIDFKNLNNNFFGGGTLIDAIRVIENIIDISIFWF